MQQFNKKEKKASLIKIIVIFPVFLTKIVLNNKEQ